MRVLVPTVVMLLAGCAIAKEIVRSREGPFLNGGPVSRDWPGAEPVVAVSEDGTVYAQGIGATTRGNVNKVWRLGGEDTRFVDVTPPGFGEERSNDGFVATGNGDRVYAANVFSLTLQVFRSEDRGSTWTALDVPRTPALAHRHWIVPVGESTVHLAVEALPPSYAPRLGGLPIDGPRTANEGMWYARSDDRGRTWTTPAQIDPVVNFAGQGPLVASADGTLLFVPRYAEDRPVAEYTYADGGL